MSIIQPDLSLLLMGGSQKKQGLQHLHRAKLRNETKINQESWGPRQ